MSNFIKFRGALTLIICLGFFEVSGQINISFNDSEDSIYLKGYNIISAKQFVEHPVILSNGQSLKRDSLLFYFYPGKIYSHATSELIDTNQFVSVWKCPDCKPNHLIDAMGDSLVFIDTLMYESRNLMLDYYTDAQNNRYAWFAANTTEYQFDFILTGRFTPGFLSMALLKLEPNGWKTITFEPFVGAFGQFCMAPKPELIQLLPNHNAVTLKDYSGGPGGPFISTLFVFDFQQNKFNQLLALDEADFSYTDDSYWHSKILPSIDDLSNTVIILTEGKLAQNDVKNKDYFDITILPENLQKLLKKQSKVNFSIKRTYKLEGQKLILMSTDFKHN